METVMENANLVGCLQNFSLLFYYISTDKYFLLALDREGTDSLVMVKESCFW